MNVLVTGGTGFVGREIVRQLRNAGHRIHLLARNPESPATREVAHQYSAKVHPGNVLDDTSLRGVFSGIDAVIHLVGIISEVRDQTFENVHVRGTRNVVAEAQNAKVAHFLHMSALGTRENAPSHYHQSKWKAEDSVRHSGLGWTIFRPSIIYGPDDGFVNMFAKIIRLSPVVPVLGSRSAQYQPLAVKQVGMAFVKALTETRTVGETYDLCGPEALTLEEIIDAIMQVMKRRRLKVHVPAGLAWFQAALLEWIYPRLLRKAPPLNRDQLILLQEGSVGNGLPADLLFGLKQTPFVEGIGGYLK
jgi:uncharacterized protein YbjT (DUF2867 family)